MNMKRPSFLSEKSNVSFNKTQIKLLSCQADGSVTWLESISDSFSVCRGLLQSHWCVPLGCCMWCTVLLSEWSCAVGLSVGCSSRDLKMLNCVWYALIPCDCRTLAGCSDSSACDGVPPEGFWWGWGGILIIQSLYPLVLSASLSLPCFSWVRAALCGCIYPHHQAGTTREKSILGL